MYFPRPLAGRSTLNGIAFEYLERGEGPDLLYLHPGEGADPDSPLIAKLAERYRVLMPAHPGFGTSDRPRHFDSVTDLAYFHLDLLAARGMRDVVVVGTSIGAWIAAEMAAIDSSRISALVLDNPLGLRFSERTERDFFDIFHISPTEWTKYHLAGAPEDERIWADEPEDVALRAARNREAFMLFGWSPYLHNPKLRHRLHRIDVPALVLWGEEDRIASRAYAEAYAKALPRGSFKAIAGAGHYGAVDQPAVVADAVIEFAGAPAMAGAES